MVISDLIPIRNGVPQNPVPTPVYTHVFPQRLPNAGTLARPIFIYQSTSFRRSSPKTTIHNTISLSEIEFAASRSQTLLTSFSNWNILPAGDVKSAFALRNDMTEAIANVLTSPGHKNKVYSINNTDNVSLQEKAQDLVQIVVKQINYVAYAQGRLQVDKLSNALASFSTVLDWSISKLPL